jgi:hypothetical protein
VRVRTRQVPIHAECYGRTTSIARPLSIYILCTSNCYTLQRSQCHMHYNDIVIIIIETRPSWTTGPTRSRAMSAARRSHIRICRREAVTTDRRSSATGKRDRTNVVVVASTPVAAALVVALVVVVVVHSRTTVVVYAFVTAVPAVVAAVSVVLLLVVVTVVVIRRGLQLSRRRRRGDNLRRPQ